MLVAKSKTSRFSHVTASDGYACPAPGPDMFTMGLELWYVLYKLIWNSEVQDTRIREGVIDVE